MDELLTKLMRLLNDPIDALTFCDDDGYPLDDADRHIAKTIRSMHSHFSDSTIDDLLDLLQEALIRDITFAPVTISIPTMSDSLRMVHFHTTLCYN